MKKLFLSAILILTPAIYAANQVVAIKSQSDFNNKIASGNVVVDFYADWCGPCKKMHPVLTALASELPNVTFVQLNIDSFESLANTYAVRSIPLFVFFKNGKEVGRKTGFISKAEFKKLVQTLFA